MLSPVKAKRVPPQRLDTSSLPARNGSLGPPSASYPKSSTASNFPAKQVRSVLDPSLSTMDPNEIFVKFTVSEIRGIQTRLRTEADAKQEELRLMVGERYRDLLQASTSIIDIAKSSQRVVQALDAIKEGCIATAQEDFKTRTPVVNRQDSQLKTMQILAAHVKLLLDSPESLWRLLERKAFLEAAWLFLISRVAFHTLARDNSDDDDNSFGRDIDVMEQFPLIQRQWDDVSHFGPQITHRTIQSFRENVTDPGAICAAVVTLHLLDKQTVTEILGIFTSQRTKSLQVFLQPQAESVPLQPNGSAKGKPNSSRKGAVKGVYARINQVRSILFSTAAVGRAAFGSDACSCPGLVPAALKDIQLGSRATGHRIPDTDSILALLPSSTNLLMLPDTIRAYKPYIDADSPPSVVSPQTVDSQLKTWVSNSLRTLEPVVKTLFGDLESIKEVWTVRDRVRLSLPQQNILDDEVWSWESLVDAHAKLRTAAIWKESLQQLLTNFRAAIEGILKEVRSSPENPLLEAETTTFLLSPVELPITQASLGPQTLVDIKGSVRERLSMRTPQVAKLLKTLEERGSQISRDMAFIPVETKPNVTLDYQQDVQSTLDSIIESLTEIISTPLEEPSGSSDAIFNSVIFVGQLAHKLATSSPFLQVLVAKEKFINDVRERLEKLHQSSLHKWKLRVSSLAASSWKRLYKTHFFAPTTHDDLKMPSRLSSALSTSLYELNRSCQQLNVSDSSSTVNAFIRDALIQFAELIRPQIQGSEVAWNLHAMQTLVDMRFLQSLCDLWADEAEYGTSAGINLRSTTTDILDKLRSLQTPETIKQLEETIDQVAERSLAASQLTLSFLIPSSRLVSQSPPISPTKRSHTKSHKGVSPLSIPSTELETTTAIDLVKPSTRFGLLLVGNTRSISRR
ncbi:hypothetical protein SISNIDRAFT_485695 [Sistotremastrum niveocremeum HHB9708]|uniref:Conserved oligomeric Golgi complex subunit 1 n=1 Tax=Sistotremastrum niveocremeum HHB9708 TaxID=1314777 RepID=A0A164UQE6_9AGAM|nr:hypothetical protein SISNIDRAFT_485695 [Sistotremastrum niveocremeum HHB9708]